MPVFAPERLVEAGVAIFRAVGAPDDVAHLVARSLVEANLAGHDSHGVLRIPSYVEDVRAGRVQPAERPAVLREGPTTALVDGRAAFGQLTARFAMEQAIARARRAQVAAVAAVRVNHIGRLGEWVELAAGAGLIGLATTAWGAGPYAATPFGGAARALSTNPIAFGLPLGERPPVVVDFATTVVAEGKLRDARARGARLPEGCILDREGQPSTDPEDYYAGGMLLPFGGHKGYGLAVAVELLSIALAGADDFPFAGRENGAFFLCLDPAAFRAPAAYGAAADRIADRLKAVPPAPGRDAVLLPGEPEQRSRAARREGITLPEATWAAISATAESLGVAL